MMNPAGATVTTVTTTTTTRQEHAVDDAKYDVRVKQRLLRNSNIKKQSLRRKKKNASSLLDNVPMSIRMLLLLSSLCLLIGFVTVLLHMSVLMTTTTPLNHNSPSSNMRRDIQLPKQAKEKSKEEDKLHVFPSSTSFSEHFQILRSILLQQPPPNAMESANDEEIASRATTAQSKQLRQVLLAWLQQEDDAIVHNDGLSSPRWIRPYLLPPIRSSSEYGQKKDQNGVMDDKLINDLVGNGNAAQPERLLKKQKKKKDGKNGGDGGFNNLQRSLFFRVTRNEGTSLEALRKKKPAETPRMQWREDYAGLLRHGGLPGPAVDYTRPELYTYPDHIFDPPDDASYPPLQSLGELMRRWPQDEDIPDADDPRIAEQLQHFDFQDPAQLQVAERYRDAELPFKLYNIPEVDRATAQWTDDYVSRAFDSRDSANQAKGTAQESRSNYFAFYVAKMWDLERMGLPPTRNNDWDFRTWSQHARYADAVRLTADRPHFYWQSGVPPEERYQHERYHSFISRDLPSFSSRTDNFFVFHVQEQKGIQCRFGERGVVAATHFDSGRNMVAMVQGAKRYILSPPNQCSKLGIFTNKRSPIYRHSLLNFGHISLMNDTTNTMSTEERQWLQRAATSQAVETVLKQGEVLYIPSHWFHYIVSLQKSAQCNVRSGIDMEGTYQFGGRKEVEECVD